ncbi:uncharacterized protein BJ212DRAFT_1302443 [Suillus subaureus]|uniref:Uncharacterized protein n=1 Tax=Suillus subaureus TaxID=48587 RepID=A0A9P7E2W6_9AGAM|nr:uncharacterized protein BJ212DRAFT_1302443 [Suillus subaureus]KAG1809596.1 hypothetical protein BJ212DRAFT_1302443 [Suillus subaureus]
MYSVIAIVGFWDSLCTWQGLSPEWYSGSGNTVTLKQQYMDCQEHDDWLLACVILMQLLMSLTIGLQYSSKSIFIIMFKFQFDQIFYNNLRFTQEKQQSDQLLSAADCEIQNQALPKNIIIITSFKFYLTIELGDTNFNHLSSSSRMFSDISSDKYKAVLKLVFETKHIYPTPRFMFIEDKSLLIVGMALPLHEIDITFLVSELSLM